MDPVALTARISALGAGLFQTLSLAAMAEAPSQPGALPRLELRTGMGSALHVTPPAGWQHRAFGSEQDRWVLWQDGAEGARAVFLDGFGAALRNEMRDVARPPFGTLRVHEGALLGRPVTLFAQHTGQLSVPPHGAGEVMLAQFEMCLAPQTDRQAGILEIHGDAAAPLVIGFFSAEGFADLTLDAGFEALLDGAELHLPERFAPCPEVPQFLFAQRAMGPGARPDALALPEYGVELVIPPDLRASLRGHGVWADTLSRNGVSYGFSGHSSHLGIETFLSLTSDDGRGFHEMMVRMNPETGTRSLPGLGAMAALRIDTREAVPASLRHELIQPEGAAPLQLTLNSKALPGHAVDWDRVEALHEALLDGFAPLEPAALPGPVNLGIGGRVVIGAETD